MAAQIGDMHNLDRASGTEKRPAVPYASRGAGLYSEVSWDPIASQRQPIARAADRDSAHPISPA